ncbi:hypothetical protein IGI04_026525, partial [Brassica rapa subsp. trilocularis]
DIQGLKIQTFSFHSLKYYSQISPLILLSYYDNAACVLRKMCLDAKVVRVIVIQKTLIKHAEKLRQVKAVLEEGGNFSGIYRKVQLKPLKWDDESEE